jgi:hypothetical protein
MTDLDFEAQLRTIASQMDYPRTPNIADSVSARLRSHRRFPSKAAAWSLTIAHPPLQLDAHSTGSCRNR